MLCCSQHAQLQVSLRLEQAVRKHTWRKSAAVQDPEAGNEATSELLARQFTALGAGMGDEVPAVRAGALQGTAIVLHRFWELVPAGLSASLLARLASERP